MPKISIQAGATSQTVNIFVRDSSSTTGGGLTGLVFNTANLTAYYALPKAAAVSITLATLAAVTSVYSSGGFKEIDATNMPGWYRFDIPDAALASGIFVSVLLKGATNMAPLPIEIELTGWNNQDAVHGGMTALPNTACTTNASLLTSGTGTDQLSVSSGVAKANATQINSVATTSVTTVNANIGTTQPTNFTGTGASALVKSDVVDIAGAAVSTTTAQIGVNAVQLNAQTVTAAAGVTFPSSVASPTNITAGTITTVTNLTNAPTAGDFTATMKTSLNASTPASVTTVTGNVNGSVGSVTARVTANTDELAGQTVTAAAGVTFPASVASPTNITAASGVALTSAYDAAKTAAQAGDIMKVSSGTGANQISLAAGLVTVGTNDDKTGYSLTQTFPTHFSSLAIDASGDVTVSGLTSAAQTNVEDAVWDATLASHLASGSTGAALNAAGSAGDPWSTALPGAYGAGTAGAIVGDNLNATVSSRSTYAGTDTPGTTTLLTRIPGTVQPQTGDSFARLGAPAGASVSADIAQVESNVLAIPTTAAPTAAANADELLGRNIGGGSNGGRTVTQALQVMRNKVTTTGGAITVYQQDDTTVSWSGTLTTDGAALPIVTVDPS